MTADAVRAPARRPRLALPALLVLLVAPASLAAQVAELPRPNLELLEEGVARQLAERRESVDALFAAGTASAEELAEAVGMLGGLYYLYDYVDLARLCLSEAVRLEAGEPLWPYLIGLAARLEGDTTGSEEAFVRALELSPNDPVTLVRLGDARLALGRAEEAEASYRSALVADEKRPGAHYGLGRIAAGRGDHAAAIRHFERAVELQPSATSVHHQIGMAYRALGDLDRARDHLGRNTGGRLRVVDPVIASLNSELEATARVFSAGTQAMRAGDYERAIEIFQAARTERPDDHLVDYNLALAYLRTDQREKARAALEASVAKKPDFRNGHFNLGQFLIQEGRIEEAQRHLRRAHEIDPEDELAHLEWATALARMGESARAAEELTSLLVSRPQLVTARLRLAQLQLAAGATEDAAEGFRQVLEGDAAPEDVVPAAMGRAAALGRLGRFADAAEAFSVVIERAPEELEAHFGRAMALLLGSSHAPARSALEESLGHHPENVALRHLYSRVLATSPDETVRDGERALEIANEVFDSQQTLAHAETVAMALAETGRFREAVDWQRRVVAQAQRSGQAGLTGAARRRLAGYEREEPCRAPWKNG